MKRFALSLILTLVFVGNLLAQNTSVPTYDVRRYGAKGDGTTDDTAAIAAAVSAAVAYQAANDKPAMVVFPRGTYIVQDSSTGTDTSPPVLVPNTSEDIVLMGYEATLKIGTNGVQTSAVRVQGSRCRVVGLTVDANAANAPLDTDTANTYDTKSNSGFEINGSGSEGVEGTDCIIQDCKVINADKGVTTYSTGTIAYDHDGPDNMSSGTPSDAVNNDNNLVTISGGTLPGWVDTDCAITISGVRYPIEEVLGSTTLTLEEDSTTQDNNPGSDVAAGTAYAVTGYPTVSQGEEAFLMVQATRSKFVNCHSFDSSWQAFRVRGNQNQVVGCSAYNHLGNGLRILAGDEVHIIGFNSYSARNDGRHAIIADAGSSVDSATDTLADILDDSDVRMKHIYISDCYLECNPDGDFEGAASTLKLAAAYEAHVSKSTIIAGNATNNIGVRIEDCLRLVTLEKCYIEPNVHFTPSGTAASVYQSEISAHANAAGGLAGYVQYTVTGGAALVNGKTLFVRGSGIDQYNGPQIILSASAGSIITDRPYVAGTLGSLTFGQSSVDTLKMRDCVVVGMGLSADGSGAAAHYNYAIEHCNAYNVDIENCEFRMKERVNVKMGGMLTDYESERALTRLRFVKNKADFNTDKICRVIRNTANTELLTSGRIVCYGNDYHNRHTGVVYLNNPFTTDDTTTTYDERDILFSGDGEKPGLYAWTTYPVDSNSVNWLAGDYIRNSAPSSGEPNGWYCITAGSPGTWRALPNSQLQYGGVDEVGNVGTGEDDLLSYTLPANTVLRQGDTLEIEAGFTFAANGNNKRIRFYLQGNSYYDSTAVAQNAGSMVLKLSIVWDNSVLSKFSSTVQTTGSGAVPNVAQAGAGAFTPTNSAIIKATGEATSNNDVVQEYMTVKLHRAP